MGVYFFDPRSSEDLAKSPPLTRILKFGIVEWAIIAAAVAGSAYLLAQWNSNNTAVPQQENIVPKGQGRLPDTQRPAAPPHVLAFIGAVEDGPTDQEKEFLAKVAFGVIVGLVGLAALVFLFASDPKRVGRAKQLLFYGLTFLTGLVTGYFGS